MKNLIIAFLLCIILCSCTSNKAKKIEFHISISGKEIESYDSVKFLLVGHSDTFEVAHTGNSLSFNNVDTETTYCLIIHASSKCLTFKNVLGKTFIPDEKVTWDIGAVDTLNDNVAGLLSEEEFVKYRKGEEKIKEIQYIQFSPENEDGIQLVNKVF